MRYVTIIVATLAAAVWAVVVARHIQTVMALREYGDTTFPLAPWQLLPLPGIVASVLLLRKNRSGAACAAALATLLLVTLLLAVQGASRAG
jgi:hypothetical protein